MSKSKKHKKDKPAWPSDEQPGRAEGGDSPETLQLERDDLLARLQRLSADYLNYQKRVQRDIAEAREFANEELIKSLLGVLDDMERALDAARANHAEDDPLLEGMQLVHDKAFETLGKFGLSAIEAAGRPFDPEKHSAMMQQASDEHPPQTVLQELQKGYLLKGRTIRPARVVVSVLPEDQDNSPKPENGEQ